MTISPHGRLALAASASAFILTSGLITTPAAADPVAKTDTTTVGEVVVTAERRKQNLQTAPIAATALTGADLERKGVVDVDSLQFVTPALTINNFGQGNDFNIRGVGKGETNVQTPSGVVTYRDGVATFPGFFQDEPFYDEADVEVLRGPQGTFSGQNATGGAIYVTSKDPSLTGNHGDVQAQYGNYNDVQLRGAINLPLSDTLAARIAFNDEYHDSFYKITGAYTGHPGVLKESNLRLGVLWQPDDKLKVLWKTDFNYIDQGGYPAAPPGGDPFKIGNNANNVALDRFIRTSLNISYQLANGMTFRSISAYQYGNTAQAVDLDGTNAAGLTFSDFATEEIYSEEINLISPDTGPLRWVGGLYFQHDLVTIPKGGFDIGVPPGGFDIDLIYKTPKQTEAVFGQATYDVTDAVQIQAGARYTYSSFDLSDLNYTLLGGAPFTSTPATGHTDDPKLTGKIDVNWKLDANNFVYAFVATGHKTGGINTSLEPPKTTLDPIRPEDVTDYEIGWKPTFFDGHMRMQNNLFYSRYTDFQFTYTAPGNPASEVLNSQAPTILYGAEMDAQAVFGAFSLDFDGAYIHSRLGSFITTDPNSGNPQDLGGNRQPNAPKWTFSVGARYVFDLDNGAKLTPSVQYGYVGDQWTSVFQKDPADAATHLAQRNLVNGDIRYDTGPWEVAAYATNLFNLHYYAAANVGLAYAGPPQQFGLRVKRSF